MKVSQCTQQGETTIESHQQEQGRLEISETIAGHLIQYNDARHLVIIDGIILTCSPGEYRVLLPLLQSPDRRVPFAQLLVGPYDPDDWRARRNLGCTVSHLRGKLWPFGFDILCLFRHGYQLVTTGDGAEP